MSYTTVLKKQRCVALNNLIVLHMYNICDVIWENPSDVAKWHFEKWLEIVKKLVYNSIELLNII